VLRAVVVDCVAVLSGSKVMITGIAMQKIRTSVSAFIDNKMYFFLDTDGSSCLLKITNTTYEYLFYE
jgi:hypothetical protein